MVYLCSRWMKRRRTEQITVDVDNMATPLVIVIDQESTSDSEQDDVFRKHTLAKNVRHNVSTINQNLV